MIDLYQMHRARPGTPIEETLAALNELVQEGKVRYIGSSNYSAEQIEDAERVARERGLTSFVCGAEPVQLRPPRGRGRAAPACERLGIGLLPYFPLASGLLTGKYVRGEAATEGRLAGREIADVQFDRVAALQAFADERGVALLDVAFGGLPRAGGHVRDRRRDEARAGARERRTGAVELSAEDLEELRALR